MNDNHLPYTTFELISVYAELLIHIPKAHLPYFKTYDNVSVMVVQRGWYIVVSVRSDKVIVDLDMNELPIYKSNDDVLYYKLDFERVIDGIKNNYIPYYVKNNNGLMDYSHGVDWWGSLYNKSDMKIMNVKIDSPFKRDKFDKILLEKMLTNSKIAFIPIRLLHVYYNIAFGTNKKIKLPYITIRNCLRSIPVPYNGVGPVYIGVRKNITVYDNKGVICKPDNSKYGLLSDDKPVVIPIYYWDFMKLLFSTFEYKFIDNDTGEILKFNDAVHSRFMMLYRKRTSDGIRPLFISLNV